MGETRCQICSAAATQTVTLPQPINGKTIVSLCEVCLRYMTMIQYQPGDGRAKGASS